MFNASHSAMIAMGSFGLVFLLVWGVGFVIFLRFYRDKRRAISRLREVSAASAPASQNQTNQRGWTQRRLPLIGALFLPKENNRIETIKTLLGQAGIFYQHGPQAFFGVKWLLMLVLPIPAGIAPYFLAWLPLKKALLFGLTACVLGMWAPHFWLVAQVQKRKRLLLSGFPDALDMLVLCLEGGISLQAAIQEVTEELQSAFPELGTEMRIMQSEIQLGLSPGEALKMLAQRCGLEEVRELAATIIQSEQFGASVVKAFRGYAECYRVQRQQRAEELAQKAAVKILFPTLLFIFPAIFIVLLGPAAFQIAKIFAR